MKILKYFIFLILLIVIGGAIYFGTKDGSYNIQDTMTIAAPPAVVFDKVNDFKTWESWIYWKQEDPDIIFNYAEKSSGEGASLSWEGKERGSITTTKVIPNSEIDQELSFQSPTGIRNAKMYWVFESVGDSTKVTWGTKGEHTLMDKVYSTIKKSDFEAKIHKMNSEGLQKISQEVVADMKKYSINVDGVTQYGGGYYMYTTSVAKQQEVEEKSVSMMNLVQNFVVKNNLNISGSAFILYNDVDSVNNTVIFSTCFPVKERVITPDNSPVVCGFMEPVSTVKITLKGNYKHLREAKNKGLDYIRNNGLEIDATRKIFEIYITDTKKELNPANWITELYIPIQTNEPFENEM